MLNEVSGRAFFYCPLGCKRKGLSGACLNSLFSWLFCNSPLTFLFLHLAHQGNTVLLFFLFRNTHPFLSDLWAYICKYMSIDVQQQRKMSNVCVHWPACTAFCGSAGKNPIIPAWFHGECRAHLDNSDVSIQGFPGDAVPLHKQRAFIEEEKILLAVSSLCTFRPQLPKYQSLK